ECRRARSPLDFGGQLLARKDPPFECQGDRRRQLLDLGAPHRAAPCRRAEGGEPVAKLSGGQQMQRPAHRPELHEPPFPPEFVVDRAAPKPIDSCPEAQLCGGRKLRVEPADVADHTKESARRWALDETMPLHPPREGLFPRKRVLRTRHEAKPARRHVAVGSVSRTGSGRLAPLLRYSASGDALRRWLADSVERPGS